MTPSETNEYAHLILTPVAQAWREQFPKAKQPFSLIKNARECRIKFVNKKVDKEWQAFCRVHNLKSEETLEY